MKPMVVLGAGGYAQDVAWIIDDSSARLPTGYLLGYLDSASPHRGGQILYECTALGDFEAAATVPKKIWFACGIGQPSFLKTKSDAVEARGWQLLKNLKNARVD